MTAPLRVVQVVYGLSVGDTGGGSELFGIRLAQALRAATDWDVTICPLWTYGTAVEQHWTRSLLSQGLEVCPLAPYRPNVPMRFNLFNAVLGGRRFFQHRAPTIIDSHGEYPDLVSMLSRPLAGGPQWVRTGHTYRDWTTKPLLGRLLHMVFPLLCTAEVGVSHAVVDRLDRRPAMRLLSRQARFIPNAIAIDARATRQSSKDLRAELGLPPDLPVIGTVARITEQKGLTYLVAAMDIVRQVMPELHLLVVGTGDLSSAVQRQIDDFDLGESITLLGSRADVPDLLAQFDLFVLPSLWEGLPTVVLEAMALGVPVLATDIPGTRELVIDSVTGTLVAPRDPAALAAAIVAHYRRPEVSAALIAPAREHARRFSIDLVAAEYVTLYRDLVGSTES